MTKRRESNVPGPAVSQEPRKSSLKPSKPIVKLVLCNSLQSHPIVRNYMYNSLVKTMKIMCTPIETCDQPTVSSTQMSSGKCLTWLCVFIHMQDSMRRVHYLCTGICLAISLLRQCRHRQWWRHRCWASQYLFEHHHRSRAPRHQAQVMPKHHSPPSSVSWKASSGSTSTFQMPMRTWVLAVATEAWR